MRTIALITALAAGCVGELDEPTTATTTQEAGCPPQYCGTNSDITARNGIWEANLNGLADVNGVSLVTRTGTTKPLIYDWNDRPYYLKVVNGKISGKPVVGTGGISGQGLVGAGFQFKKNGTVIYSVSIEAVRTIPLAVDPWESVEVYTLSWHSRSGVPVPDCPAGMGLGVNETLVFEGDRIDPARLTMSTDAQWDPSWFSMGCGSSVVAKLRMLRMTKSNQAVSDWALRQATLKMLTADYCGNGHNWTRLGTPIGWRDDARITDYAITGVTPSHVEARWDQNGAKCLNTPRLTAAGVTLYTDEMVRNMCPLLVCSDPNLWGPPSTGTNGARVVSANP
ncbi:MAG: hypothetical protein JNL83_04145 [Myxococcales bacterium]|nr:hypothetical protein [Myxococcales bacterium]